MSSLEKRKEGMGPGEYEQKAVEAGFVRVCGCDEAGALEIYQHVFRNHKGTWARTSPA